MQMLNMHGFPQTVLVESWVCSLSVACAMLVLVAACRVPWLRSLVGPDAMLVGDHVKRLLQSWQRLACSGPPSPSVDQNIRVIDEADRFLKVVYLLTPPEGSVARRPSNL